MGVVDQSMARINAVRGLEKGLSEGKARLDRARETHRGSIRTEVM